MPATSARWRRSTTRSSAARADGTRSRSGHGALRLRRAGPSRLGGPRAGGLADEVVALGDVRRAAGGFGVGRGGGGEVAAELVQVAAGRVPAVAVAEHVAETVGLA